MSRVLDGTTIEAGTSLECEYAVIGTGAGGSVAAHVLAKAGKDVLMIEAGPLATAEDFSQREDEMTRKLWVNQGAQTTVDGLVGVAQGSCVGGSTTINGGDLVPTAEAVFQFWRRHRDLEAWDFGVWRASERRVLDALGANVIPPELRSEDAMALKRGAELLGWRAGVFLNNRVGCVGAGYCLIGCSYNAKRSALVTYVPQALAEGARLVHRAKVDAIRPLGQGEGFEISVNGKRGPTVRSRRVICAAGAIQTPILLDRSGLEGDSGMLGQKLSLQPQVPILGRFKHPISSYHGIPQIVYVDQFETASEEAGYGGFRLETASSGPASGAALLPGLGADHFREYISFSHYAGCLVLVPDRPAGRVTKGLGARAGIFYDLHSDVVERMKRGIVAAGRAYFEVGAEEILLPWEDGPHRARNLVELEMAVEQLKFESGRINLFSAHPQGTARAAHDPSNGVVNEWGEHHQIPGLYVMDASVFPTTASSHTMLPIMALADMLTHRLV